jgi:hypothetical protein
MKYLLTIILFLVSNFCRPQSSLLYNGDRKLIIDSSYQIDKNSYNCLLNLEKVLLPRIYNQIKYPEIARENNEEGKVIVLIKIDSELKEKDFSIVKSDAETLLPTVIEFFKHLLENNYLLEQIKPRQGILNIYIPVEFKINKNRFEETVTKNKAVTIETNDVARQMDIIREN